MKKNISLLIKVGFTVGILLFIVKKINFGQIYTTFSAPDITFLFLSFLLVIPNFALKFWKWQSLLVTSGINESFYNSARSYLAGLAMGMITPARAGEVGRALFLPKKEKLKGAGVVIVDKILDLTGITMIALLGARIFIPPVTFYLLVAFVAGGMGFLLLSSSLHRHLIPVLSKYSFGVRLSQVFGIFEQLSTTVILKNFAITLVMFFVVLLQCFFLVKTFYAPHLPFNSVLFAYPLVIVANILPITIGGLGVREGVAVVTLAIFGVPGEIAVSATLYLFIINVVFPSLIGCLVIAGAGKYSSEGSNVQADVSK